MVLPSQTAREVMASRSQSRGLTRRAARRNVWLLLLAVLVVVACLAYAGWTVIMKPAATQSSDQPSDPSPASTDGQRVHAGSPLDGAAANRHIPPEVEPVEVDVAPAQGTLAEYPSPADRSPVVAPGPVEEMTPADADQETLDLGQSVGRTADGSPPHIGVEANDPADADVQTGERITTAASESTEGDPEIDSSPVVVGTVIAEENPSLSMVQEALVEARRQAHAGRSIQARVTLSELLETHGNELEGEVEATVKRQINRLGDRLLVSRSVVAGDPLSEHYDVPSGDTFGKIGRRYKVPYRFIMEINGINVDTSLRAGQQIKVVRGPFHAVITKHAYRMDIFAEGDNGRPLFVACFEVGLGADDSTPSGRWIVRRGKQRDPDWRNPRTNRYYAASDPENPIGEYWIPLEGTDEQTRELDRYGIHGTIDPDSVGRQASMGCVRLKSKDIERVYHMLAEEYSRVTIRK